VAKCAAFKQDDLGGHGLPAEDAVLSLAEAGRPQTGHVIRFNQDL
jgi:hypothetical protein